MIRNARPYQMCTKTVMDTTDPEITFDSDGICNHYHDFVRLSPYFLYQGKESDLKKEQLVEQIKKDGKNNEFDCIMGVSGGVDSSYLAYLVKQFGLRPLVVHFDNGWNSEIAVRNIENIVKKLNFDYQTWVVNWEEFRDLQVAFLKASVANAEIPTDHAFLATLYRLCAQHNIKYNLSGHNYATESILPSSWGYKAKDLRHLKGIHNAFGTIPFKTFPLLGYDREFYYKYIKKIKIVKFLNYVPYVKTEAMSVIQKELNWLYYGGKHHESLFTRFFQCYILPEKFNIDKRKAHLSSLICSGQMTRDEALEELKLELYPPQKLKEEKEYVIKKLGLSEKEFESIMKAPVKSYKDYPNNENLLKIVRTIYNILGIGKR